MDADPITSIDAVLPLAISGAKYYRVNLARCDILFTSLGRFAEPGLFRRILIVVPRRDRRLIRAALSRWSSLPLDIIPEEDILPALRDYPRASGWKCQQLLKLAAAALIRTPFYLTLDPDLVLCKPLRIADIVVGGKAILEPEVRTKEPDWWRASAELLGLTVDLAKPGMAVTPALLSPQICKRLFADLETGYGRDWATILLEHVRSPWTEYTLYYLTGERHGLLERFHTVPAAGRPRLACRSNVWYASEFSSWDVAGCFDVSDPGLFTVMQSNTGIPVDDVRERLRPYLPVRFGLMSKAAAEIVALGWPPARRTRRG